MQSHFVFSLLQAILQSGLVGARVHQAVWEESRVDIDFSCAQVNEM